MTVNKSETVTIATKKLCSPVSLV